MGTGLLATQSELPSIHVPVTLNCHEVGRWKRVCLLASCLALLSACGWGEGEGSIASQPRLHLRAEYSRLLGVTLPVPEGWAIEENQGSGEAVLTPPLIIAHGPRITVRKLAGQASSKAPSIDCGSRQQQPALGPVTIAGHDGSYESLCPGTLIGPEWTVLLTASKGRAWWQLTYMGAPAIGRGTLAASFLAILAAFQP